MKRAERSYGSSIAQRPNLDDAMASASGSADYLLGNSDAEHERLIRQAKRLAPVTERFLREAGIGPGQRVLDVGAGVGDVTILLSHLVGPAGEVVAVERDARYNLAGR